MKISEGIRAGSAGKRQIKGAWYDRNYGVCAIGALMLMTGENIYYHFPSLKDVIDDTFKCDTWSCQESTLLNAIVKRNEEGWTFDQIIKWLESIGQ